jgi:hypothetical protein
MLTTLVQTRETTHARYALNDVESNQNMYKSLESATHPKLLGLIPECVF